MAPPPCTSPLISHIHVLQMTSKDSKDDFWLHIGFKPRTPRCKRTAQQPLCPRVDVLAIPTTQPVNQIEPRGSAGLWVPSRKLLLQYTERLLKTFLCFQALFNASFKCVTNTLVVQ